MSGSDHPDAASAGWGCLGVVIVISLVVMAIISLGALVDPFDWMPTVEEVWADCEDESGGTACDLNERFPGFWLHLVVNLVFITVAVAALLVFVDAVLDVLDRRPRRYVSVSGASAFAEARRTLLVASVLLAGTAALPVVVAVA